MNSFTDTHIELNISWLKEEKKDDFVKMMQNGTSKTIAFFSPENRGEKGHLSPKKFFKKM